MKHLISYNESIRDKMIPKSDEDINSTIMQKIDNMDHMSYMEIGKLWILSNSQIKKTIENKLETDQLEIFQGVLRSHFYNDYVGSDLSKKDEWMNESLRDKMIPKSDEEIKKITDDKIKNMVNLIDLYNDVDEYIKNLNNVNVIVSDIEYDNFDKYVFFKIFIIDNNSSFTDSEYGQTILKIKCYNNDSGMFLSLKPIYTSSWVNINISTDFSKVKRELNKYITHNESLRDKMTPKSKEEILSKLEFHNVTFEPTRITPAPSWLIGEITTTYDALVKVFGKPTNEDLDEDSENHFEWCVKSSDGHVCNIYDRHYGEGYEKLMKIEYKWHIGGRDTKDANNLIAFIIKNTI